MAYPKVFSIKGFLKLFPGLEGVFPLEVQLILEPLGYIIAEIM